MKHLLLVSMLLTAGLAHAEIGLDDGTSQNVFKVDGKVSNPVDAAQAAPNHQIEKCSPIKGAQTISGTEQVAYKCKVVVLIYNKKTGTPHWKNK